MSRPAQSSGILRFDVYELDLRAGELYRNGRKIKLQEQPFQILAMLLEQPGQVVRREELRERLWPADTFVDFDHSLGTATKKLRKALNDEADSPRFIETLPRRGYRYIGPAVENLPTPQQLSEPAKDFPGSVSELKRDAESGGAPLAPRAPGTRWQVLALLALFAATLGLGAFFFLRRAPVLTERDTIVLADFTNTTGDVVFDSTLRQGLAVQLEQSPFLSLISDERIQQTLRLMGQPLNAKLTPEIARELCQRTESAAVLDGSIATLGSQYVLGLKAVNCRTGDTLADEQERATGKEQVLAAMDKAAAKLRAKLGESLTTVVKFDTPLVQATTPSLEALKAYSLGVKALVEESPDAAIPFYKRAIELDPNFAAAYDALGGAYAELLQEPELGAENLRKAYELRGRVSEWERLSIAVDYYANVTGELEKSDETNELWARTYPRSGAPRNMAAAIYEYLGQYDKLAEESINAIRASAGAALVYSNLMEAYLGLNRLDEAKSTYRQAIDLKFDNPFLHDDMYAVAFLEGDAEEMKRQLDWAAGKPGAEDILISAQSDTEAFHGHLGRARELSHQAVESALRNDRKETAALWQLNSALREAEFGNYERTRQELRAGLAIASNRDVRILAALALARIGDAAQAQAMTNELEKQFPSNTMLKDYWLPSIRAYNEIHLGNPTKALELLRPAERYDFAFPLPQFEEGGLMYPTYIRGQAYLRLKRGKEAAHEFQKFLERRGVVINALLAPLARYQLAQALAISGDASGARRAYQDFFALWKDADPDIPILKQAKTEYGKPQ